ncbi:MAG: hypothetical protein K1X64_14415 [Myxococcaceae bacterium]|nr:hypothetical protein [Myxococcaceae bacterium]
MSDSLASTLRQIDEQLAIGHKEARRNAYDLVMGAMRTFATPGIERDGAALFMRLGDIYAQSGDFKTALAAWTDAVHCPGALGDSQLHLRLGKAQFELGNETRAADELCRAFMGAGAEIFSTENPKYFAFLKTKIRPPAGEQW